VPATAWWGSGSRRAAASPWRRPPPAARSGRLRCRRSRTGSSREAAHRYVGSASGVFAALALAATVMRAIEVDGPLDRRREVTPARRGERVCMEPRTADGHERLLADRGGFHGDVAGRVHPVVQSCFAATGYTAGTGAWLVSAWAPARGRPARDGPVSDAWAAAGARGGDDPPAARSWPSRLCRARRRSSSPPPPSALLRTISALFPAIVGDFFRTGPGGEPWWVSSSSGRLDRAWGPLAAGSSTTPPGATVWFPPGGRGTCGGGPLGLARPPRTR